MGRDNIGDEMDAIIRNRRKYAAFWDWRQDKKVEEWDVVEELLRSMHANGDHRYRGPVESFDDDPPDCVIRDSRGKQVGVEATEFVDQDAIEVCERDLDLDVYREWTTKAVREKVEQILKSKDEKAYDRSRYSKAILVIYTDERVLQSPELFPMLDASPFPRPRNIDEAYFICSYEPNLGYPYRRLNLDGLQPPDPATEGGTQGI